MPSRRLDAQHAKIGKSHGLRFARARASALFLHRFPVVPMGEFWQTYCRCKMPRTVSTATRLRCKCQKRPRPWCRMLSPWRPAARPDLSPLASAIGNAKVAASTFERTQVAGGGVIALVPAARARMPERPLSPHLSVYKFKYTLATSILNRLAGLVLSLGLLPPRLLARRARRGRARLRAGARASVTRASSSSSTRS